MLKIHYDLRMNTLVPIVFKHRRRRSSRMQIPKSVVLPFAKSKMIKVCNWKTTVVAISRSDSNFSMKKKRKYKTIVPRWFYDFNPRDLQFDAKCLICSLSLFVSLNLFLLSFTLSHTRSHHVFRCIVASFPSCILRIWFYNNISLKVFVTL